MEQLKKKTHAKEVRTEYSFPFQRREETVNSLPGSVDGQTKRKREVSDEKKSSQ